MLRVRVSCPYPDVRSKQRLQDERLMLQWNVYEAVEPQRAYSAGSGEVVIYELDDVAVIPASSQGSHTKYLRTQRLSNHDETGRVGSLAPCRGLCPTASDIEKAPLESSQNPYNSDLPLSCDPAAPEAPTDDTTYTPWEVEAPYELDSSHGSLGRSLVDHTPLSASISINRSSVMRYWTCKMHIRQESRFSVGKLCPSNVHISPPCERAQQLVGWRWRNGRTPPY
jgi:hypothetical protein